MTFVPGRTSEVSTVAGSRTRALRSSSWSLATRTARSCWRCFRAWYSKFSERSPSARASASPFVFSGMSTSTSFSSSFFFTSSASSVTKKLSSPPLRRSGKRISAAAKRAARR